MAPGNSTISEKSKFTWGVVLVIVMVALSWAGVAYNVQSGLAVHSGDADRHHATAELDAKYAQQQVMTARLDAVIQRLDRIERKLDKLDR